MKHRLIILLLIFTSGLAGYGQSMIGLNKEQVVQTIREEFREFHRDNLVVRQQFNYLKFVNRSGTKTWILHFSEEDICLVSRLVCDYSEYDRMLGELNSTYGESGDLKWEFSHDSGAVQVELIREEWYFTIQEAWKQKSY